MNPTSSKGFTLVEILIAMSILVIVLSTIFTSYSGTFKIIHETESQANVYEMARIALERMQEDLESAYICNMSETSESGDDSIKPGGFVGENKDIEGRSVDALRFFSRAHLVFDEENEDAGIAEITYYVMENGERDGLTLYRSDTAEFEEAASQETSGLILCDGLSSINITYHDGQGEAYDSWDSTREEFDGRLPAMVSVFLEFINTSNPEQPLKFMTGVALPAAREAYGKSS